MSLSEPYGTCGEPVGGHTVAEWYACMGKPVHDLPFADAGPPVQVDGGRLTPADHVDASAAIITDPDGLIPQPIPALVLRFGLGKPGHPPEPVAEIALLAEPDTMRKVGKLLRDTANAAANKTEALRR